MLEENASLRRVVKKSALPKQPLNPIVKWAGGKRQLLNDILPYVPSRITTYYEPFLGGGAVLLALQPHKAVVNDINGELINLYTVVKNNVEELIADLQTHHNDEEYFYTIRALDRDPAAYKALSDVQRASRIHYLNKTCFNGLFRVNQAGEFNAPFGKYKNPNITNEASLRAVNTYFNQANITFRNTDFIAAVKGARKGAFVYFDPPYDPVSDSANFTGYAKHGFDRNEQIRLKELCDKLANRGVTFLLSNAATPFILELYAEYDTKILQARRAINAKGDARGEVDEVLVMYLG